jgi:hypothetical protein
MIGFLHFGLMWGHPGKKLLFIGGEYRRWTREHSCIEAEDPFGSGNDFRMRTARVTPSIVEDGPRDRNPGAFNAKWGPNGEDLRMQFADHVGSSKCKRNDAGRLGKSAAELR